MNRSESTFAPGAADELLLGRASLAWMYQRNRPPHEGVALYKFSFILHPSPGGRPFWHPQMCFYWLPDGGRPLLPRLRSACWQEACLQTDHACLPELQHLWAVRGCCCCHRSSPGSNTSCLSPSPWRSTGSPPAWWACVTTCCCALLRSTERCSCRLSALPPPTETCWQRCAAGTASKHWWRGTLLPQRRSAAESSTWGLTFHCRLPSR